MNIEEKIKENERLVKFILQKYFSAHRTYLHEEELIQLGFIGLWKAVKNFDESKNIKFSTYACKMIWGEMARYLRDFYGRDDKPKGQKKRENGYIIADLSEYNNSNNVCFTSYQGNYVEEVLNKYDKENALKTINKRDREIFELYYYKEYSQSKIAEKYNISQIQVSRILKKTRENIKEKLKIVV